MKTSTNKGKAAVRWRVGTPVVLTAALLTVAISAPPGGASDVVGHQVRTSPSSAAEVLEYSWKLGGVKGALARVFVPGHGEGTLRTVRNGSGHFVSELEIRSRSRQGEFWLYGAEIDPAARRTVRAWQEQLFRGESKERRSELTGQEVLDLTSSIYFLRRDLPDESRIGEMWSSGKLYPIKIEPSGRGGVRRGERTIPTRSYSLRGLHRPGKQFWKGKLDLVVTDDDEATPLEIVVERKGLAVRLELNEAVRP